MRQHVVNIIYKYTLLIGVVYTYLAEGVGPGAFHALSRGFTHWASGRMELLEMNLNNPDFCHVCCAMKPGVYKVYVLLQKEHEYVSLGKPHVNVLPY